MSLMSNRPTITTQTFVAAVALTIVSGGSHIRAAGPGPACALVKAAEIEAIVGAKVWTLVSGPVDLGNGVDVCTGTAGDVAINIRFLPSAGKAGADGTTRIVDWARRMGSAIESSASGPVVCYVITPPDEMSDTMPTGTMCAVTKSSSIAVIELSTKTAAARVPMPKLQALARKILSRL
jgi:hypothetical protein